MSKACPNCGEPIQGHPDNACVLLALIKAMRATLPDFSEELLRHLHEVATPDIWREIAPLMDGCLELRLLVVAALRADPNQRFKAPAWWPESAD